MSMDNLARDAAEALKANMTYGKWKAMQNPVKVEKKETGRLNQVHPMWQGIQTSEEPEVLRLHLSADGMCRKKAREAQRV